MYNPFALTHKIMLFHSTVYFLVIEQVCALYFSFRALEQALHSLLWACFDFKFILYLLLTSESGFFLFIHLFQMLIYLGLSIS